MLPIILTYILAALTVAIILLVIDSAAGYPLSEQVTVQDRKFSPATLIFTGKTLIPVPKRWTIKVENRNGRGVVPVSEKLYDAVTQGQTILVTGKRGRFSGNWYLKKAELGAEDRNSVGGAVEREAS